MSDSSADWLVRIGADTDSDSAARTADRTDDTYEYALDACTRLRLLTDNAKVCRLQLPPAIDGNRAV
jgi:hypothetical protein